MTNPIQQKLERDYARAHPPGAPITQPAKVWLAELAETMANLTEEREQYRVARDEAAAEILRLTRKFTEVRHMYAEQAAASGKDTTKRDKLVQRFAAAIVSNGRWGGPPERLRELAEDYADAFYPESGR